MSSHPTFVTNLDNPDDLLLSYLNADYLDTTTATDDVANTSPSSSSNYDDAPFTPISSNHPFPPFPFSLAMNSLASQFMDTFGGGLTVTGVSPCSLSRGDDRSSFQPKLNPPPTFVAPPLTSCTNASFISPTLSMATTSSSFSSSSDLDKPKRKRERKNQNGSKRRGTSPTTTTAPLLACKPILPAEVVISDQRLSSSSLVPLPTNTTTIIKHEPVDMPDTGLDRHSRRRMADHTTTTIDQQQQQQRCDPPMDANSKRQERLIKNRAAALLSRKRKREHLQALEDERQWLTEENGILKSKATALENKLHQLEKEHQQQAQQLLLLEQQQQTSCESDDTSSSSSSSSDMHAPFYPIPPSLESLSTVTNVLMILLVSFVLLTFPGASNNHLFTNGDSHGPSFTRSSSQSGTNSGIPSMNLTLLPKQQQQQYFSSNSGDTSNKPLAMDRRHQVYYHGEHTLANGEDNDWS